MVCVSCNVNIWFDLSILVCFFFVLLFWCLQAALVVMQTHCLTLHLYELYVIPSSNYCRLMESVHKWL